MAWDEQALQHTVNFDFWGWPVRQIPCNICRLRTKGDTPGFPHKTCRCLHSREKWPAERSSRQSPTPRLLQAVSDGRWVGGQIHTYKEGEPKHSYRKSPAMSPKCLTDSQRINFLSQGISEPVFSVALSIQGRRFLQTSSAPVESFTFPLACNIQMFPWRGREANP